MINIIGENFLNEYILNCSLFESYSEREDLSKPTVENKFLIYPSFLVYCRSNIVINTSKNLKTLLCI